MFAVWRTAVLPPSSLLLSTTDWFARSPCLYWLTGHQVKSTIGALFTSSAHSHFHFFSLSHLPLFFAPFLLFCHSGHFLLLLTYITVSPDQRLCEERFLLVTSLDSLLSLSLWFDNCSVTSAAVLLSTGRTINYRSISLFVCLQSYHWRSTHTQYLLKEKTVQQRGDHGLRQVFNAQLWRRQQESGHHQVDCHARKSITIPTGVLFFLAYQCVV